MLTKNNGKNQRLIFLSIDDEILSSSKINFYPQDNLKYVNNEYLTQFNEINNG